nr:unknown function [Klebsiella phage vB_Kpn_K21lambda1]
MKKKPVKYERLESWVEEHDARITQAGSYPAQVVFIMEEDLKSFCKHFDLPRMGPLSGGRCYQLHGDDFFAVVMCFKIDCGQLISVIAHECYHALNFIYKRYNTRHSLGNDEPAAYLISHMAYYATKFIEEQGYGLKRLDGWDRCGDGQNSGDLRAELPSPQQGRVDGSAEPATGAGGQVPRKEPHEESPRFLPCGCFGRCLGHDELTHICPTCGEEIPKPPAYHVCKPPLRQCNRCGVRYYATHEHVCSPIDVINWRKQNELGS